MPQDRNYGNKSVIVAGPRREEHDGVISVTCRDPDGIPERRLSAHQHDLAINALTSKQRAHLRSLAHPLKPVVHIGKDGVNESTISTVREAFNTRELVKIRVLDAAPLEADETGRTLVDEIDNSALVQVIGHVLVIYRPFPKNPEIRIPA